MISGEKITWNLGFLTGAEIGCVTVTVKVPDTFVGNRIDDNSCIFDVANATGKTPGPIGVVVLSGNETAQSSSAAHQRPIDLPSLNPGMAEDSASVIAAGGGSMTSINSGNLVNLDGISSLTNIK